MPVIASRIYIKDSASPVPPHWSPQTHTQTTRDVRFPSLSCQLHRPRVAQSRHPPPPRDPLLSLLFTKRLTPHTQSACAAVAVAAAAGAAAALQKGVFGNQAEEGLKKKLQWNWPTAWIVYLTWNPEAVAHQSWLITPWCQAFRDPLISPPLPSTSSCESRAAGLVELPHFCSASELWSTGRYAPKRCKSWALI